MMAGYGRVVAVAVSFHLSSSISALEFTDSSGNPVVSSPSKISFELTSCNTSEGAGSDGEVKIWYSNYFAKADSTFAVDCGKAE
eukprot:m.177577 g.177577  ORF g.177577 m.177577 type:complete len:84 (+) comp39163_c0_seq7:638-889(+)